MQANDRILVVGGTGQFGRRICRRLAGLPGTELIVTSRDSFRAQVLVDELAAENANARLTAMALDQDSADFEAGLRGAEPFIVIHTAGPYQGSDYRVAHACIEAGCHYVDLADGRDFVAGFHALDEQALRAGVLLVTGGSTLPGLSSAVVREFAATFDRIESIEESIAPAQQTPRGRGTVAAVLSYCGRPFDALQDGRWQRKFGWQDLRRQQYPELGARLSAACDVPDIDVLPRLVPGVRTVSFHAALEASWEHRVLWLMAWLTRLNVVRDWSRHAQAFTAISRWLSRRGSDRGGMAMLLRGTGLDGEPRVVDWQLTALENQGPEIPCTPAIVIAKKLLRDEITDRGARACVGFFSLREFFAELDGFQITASVTARR